MSYCIKCGHELVLKHLDNEGEIPYCPSCSEYRFPMFNTAISAIVYNPSGNKIALIQQYGKKNNILVAGYVTRGEGVEETLKREIKEELGLDVIEYHFNASSFYEKTNTLMVNFACKVNSDELTHTNEEIDYIKWYDIEDAVKEIKDGSLAERFLNTWLKKVKK